MEVLRVGVVTVSDRCSRGEAEDKSGPAIQQYLKDNIAVFKFAKSLEFELLTIPDEQDLISSTLIDLSDNKQLSLILTTGGTGFAPRDVTPEATKAVLHKDAPGIQVRITLLMVESFLWKIQSNTRAVVPVAESHFFSLWLIDRDDSIFSCDYTTCNVVSTGCWCSQQIADHQSPWFVDTTSSRIGNRKSDCLHSNPTGSPKGATENLAAVIVALPHAISLMSDLPKANEQHQKPK
jgi:molybdenum cofactor synthesis domain-containing protein